MTTDFSSSKCIGQNVIVNSYTTDGLLYTFGENGDGDWWDRDDSSLQEKYVGKVGKINNWMKNVDRCPYVTVEFSDGAQFTFDVIDLEFTDGDLTPIKKDKEDHFTPLTEKEIQLAEKLLIAKFGNFNDHNIKQQILKEIIIDCVETAIIFSHNTSLEWNKKQIIKWSKD